MGRPRKRAEWYQHFTDMKNNPFVHALRRKFGNNGYAVLNYLMEDIARTDELVLDFSSQKQEIYSAEYDVTQKQLENIVNYCVKLNLCKYSDDDKTKLYSPYLEEELLKLLREKREKDRLRKQENNKREFSTENDAFPTENCMYSTENDTDNIPRKTRVFPRKTSCIPRKSTHSKGENSREHSPSVDIHAREDSAGGWSGDDMVVYDDVDSEVGELKTAELWREQVFMRYKFLNRNGHLLDEYIDRWAQEVKISGKRHQCLGDAKKHFGSWMTIQEGKLLKNVNNGTDSNNGYRSREDMHNGTVQVMSELIEEGRQPKKPLPVV